MFGTDRKSLKIDLQLLNVWICLFVTLLLCSSLGAMPKEFRIVEDVDMPFPPFFETEYPGCTPRGGECGEYRLDQIVTDMMLELIGDMRFPGIYSKELPAPPYYWMVELIGGKKFPSFSEEFPPPPYFWQKEKGGKKKYRQWWDWAQCRFIYSFFRRIPDDPFAIHLTYSEYCIKFEYLRMWINLFYDISIKNAEEPMHTIPYFEKMRIEKLEVLQQSKENLILELRQKYENCVKQHQHPYSYYDLGKIYFDQGDLVSATNNLAQFTSIAHIIDPTILTSMGQAYCEGHAFDRAIEALTQAIELDPKNEEAFFQRAIAHFEMGKIDLAIDDYLHASSREKNSSQLGEKYFELGKGISIGLLKGGRDSIDEFVPSLLSSIHGIGAGLYRFISHPLSLSSEFVHGCLNCFDYIVENVSIETLEKMAPEVKKCIHKWNHMEDSEKGHAIGYVIGRYGVDILAWGGCMKAMSHYRQLKRANALMTLELAATSTASQREIMQASKLFHENRQKFAQKCKLHRGLQEKHIRSTKNFIEGRSEIQIPISILEAETKALIGTGLPQRGVFGIAGYQEYVEYDRIIGLVVSEKPKKVLPTRMGKVHYGKEGCFHVVPADPDILTIKRLKP